MMNMILFYFISIQNPCLLFFFLFLFIRLTIDPNRQRVYLKRRLSMLCKLIKYKRMFKQTTTFALRVSIKSNKIEQRHTNTRTHTYSQS